jgi:hypothetical protein
MPTTPPNPNLLAFVAAQPPATSAAATRPAGN